MELTWSNLCAKDMHPYLITQHSDEPYMLVYSMSKRGPVIVGENDGDYVCLQTFSEAEVTNMRGWLCASMFALVCASGMITYEKQSPNFDRFGVPGSVMKRPLVAFNHGEHYFVMYNSQNQCIIIMDHTITNTDEVVQCYQTALNAGHI